MAILALCRNWREEPGEDREEPGEDREEPGEDREESDEDVELTGSPPPR